MRFVRRILIVLGSLLLALSLAVLVATQVIELDDYRQDIARALSARLALEVRIEGPLELALSLRPTISVRDLRLYHPDSATWERPLARIGDLSMSAEAIQSLRSRKLVLSKAIMEDVQLLLVRALDGRGNWQLGRKDPEELLARSTESAEFRLQIAELEVRDFEIRYMGRPSDLEFVIELDEIRMHSESTTVPRRVAIALEGRFEKERFELDGDIEWDEETPIMLGRGDHRLRLDGHLGSTTFDVAGNLWDPRGEARAELLVSMSAPRLPALQRTLRIAKAVDLSGLGPATATARLLGGGGRVGLDPITVDIRGERDERFQAQGSIQDWVADRRFRAALRIDTHDTTRMAERFGLPAPAIGKGQGTADLEFDGDAMRLSSIRLSTVHHDGARVDIDGDLEHRQSGGWTGDVGLHIDADYGGQALRLVDDTIRRITKEQRPAGTLPGGRPLSTLDQALLRIGPAHLDARIVERGGSWGLLDLDLQSGREGHNLLKVGGRFESIAPAISGVDVWLEAGTSDLQELAERIGVDVPKVDRLRVSGKILGEPDALILKEVQLVVARGDEVSIAVHGDFPLNQDLRQTELDVSMSATDLAEVGAVFDRELWRAGPVEFQARVRGGADQLTARSIQLHLGKSRFTGDVDFVRAPHRPRLTAKLDSELIHLEDFGFEPERSVQEPSPSSEEEAFELWNEPLPLAIFGDVDLDLVLSAEKIRGRSGFDVDELTFRGSIREHLTRVADLGMTWDGGRVYVQSEIDGNVSPPNGSLRAWIDAAEVDQVLAQFTRKDVGNGLADVRVDLRSQGETLRRMLTGLDGRIVFYAREGTIAGRYSRALQLEIVPREQKDPELGDYERINCMIAGFAAKQGRVSLQSVLFDTPEQQVLATGEIDFAKRKLNVLLTPAFKQTVPGRMTAAVRVRGSLDAPRVTLEPLATAGLASQAMVERALTPLRRWLPRVGAAIDDARRGTGEALDATGLPVGGQLWVPGVDITCENFLAQEHIAGALATRPAAPDAGL